MTQQPYGPKHAKMVADAKAVKARMYAAARGVPNLAYGEVLKAPSIQSYKPQLLLTEARPIPRRKQVVGPSNAATTINRRYINSIRCPHLTLDEITRRVARLYGISVESIRENNGKGGKTRIERFAAVYLCSLYSACSNTEIANFFNYKCSKFVTRSNRRFSKRRKIDKLVKRTKVAERRSNSALESHTCERIIRRVAALSGLNVSIIKGRSQTNDVVRVRRAAMTLCYRYTGSSTPQVGRAFNRDHTTVIHAINRHKEEKQKRIASRLAAEGA